MLFKSNEVIKERDLFKQDNEVLRKRNAELKSDNIYLNNKYKELEEKYKELEEKYKMEEVNCNLLSSKLKYRMSSYLILPKNEGQVKKEALKYIRYVTDDNKYIIEINTEYKVFCYEYRGNQKEQMLEEYNKLIEQL